MSDYLRYRSPSYIQVLYNHNPLYVISAGLVLYGLQVSFPPEVAGSAGWQLLRILGGYGLLLSFSGVIVVRVAGVWEDARTILLTLILLLVALSSSFDRNCLDDTRSAMQLMGAAWVGAALLTEALPRLLGIRFRWHYRLPLQLGWVLLFTYPVYLGHLSLTDHELRMSWLVLLFPWLASVPLLSLLPAIWRGKRDEHPNGTPWKWPWYPAPVFVFLAAGFAVRAYGLSASFELANGYGGGFQPFFLIPLLLTGSLLLREVAHICNRVGTRRVATLLPLALIPLALPGLPSTEAEHRFISMMQDVACTPIVPTLAVLSAFYSYVHLRGDRLGELGLVTVALVASVMTPTTLDLLSMRSAPNPWFIVPLVVWQAVVAIRHRSYLRCVGALVLLAACTCWVSGVGLHGQEPFYILLNTGLVALHLLSLAFHDQTAGFVRRWSARLMPKAVVFAGLSYPLAFHHIPLGWHVCFVGALFMSAGLHWYFRPTLRRLLGASMATGLLVLYLGTTVCRMAYSASALRGSAYLIAGVACLSVGVAVSLSKQGNAGWVVTQLVELTRRRATVTFARRLGFDRFA